MHRYLQTCIHKSTKEKYNLRSRYENYLKNICRYLTRRGVGCITGDRRVVINNTGGWIDSPLFARRYGWLVSWRLEGKPRDSARSLDGKITVMIMIKLIHVAKWWRRLRGCLIFLAFLHGASWRTPNLHTYISETLMENSFRTFRIIRTTIQDE